ncbi:hypothetical protein JOF56_011616 [Kibdelosporangium banguiense]|uniref:Uncharacterized protein n=1 Tax=Kibdelosporangium banguiense TaxID=1365924 RepID=A0ABS4U3M1_9PSEU|nr:hypothetical protein [Kibdelosporangium banguiense]MBP2331231.1 hypothetical protein [Kibdelosporangium banguiense]
MPWYAQRAGLPDTHRHHADEGSELARVYERLGYVEVPAPGAGEPEETGVVVEPAVVEDVTVVEEPKATSRPKARS